VDRKEQVWSLRNSQGTSWCCHVWENNKSYQLQVDRGKAPSGTSLLTSKETLFPG
jgi:hypothetical protein